VPFHNKYEQPLGSLPLQLTDNEHSRPLCKVLVAEEGVLPTVDMLQTQMGWGAIR
jgi:hypothetical protein